MKCPSSFYYPLQSIDEKISILFHNQTVYRPTQQKDKDRYEHDKRKTRPRKNQQMTGHDGGDKCLGNKKWNKVLWLKQERNDNTYFNEDKERKQNSHLGLVLMRNSHVMRTADKATNRDETDRNPL